MLPTMEGAQYISREEYEEMKSLKMNVAEYREYQEGDPLESMSIEELSEELVKDVSVAKAPQFTVVVVDNFYTNPDAVRDYALTRNYVERGYHGAVGHRTLEPKHFKGTREYFESLLGSKMEEGTELGGWDYQTNGVFQHCMAEDPFVIHADDQKWAAMIYLTPDAPVECGTTLYRHKETGKDTVRKKEDWSMFNGNFYDPTPFEVVDVVGNKYNRMILFDAQHIHAASQYFGDSLQNDRVFQLFFFNTEKK